MFAIHNSQTAPEFEPNGHATLAVLSNHALFSLTTHFMSGYPLDVHQFLQETGKSVVDELSARDRALFHIGHLVDEGVFIHFAIATNNPEVLQRLHKLSKSPEYEHDLKFSFAKAMCYAVLYNCVDTLEVLRELTSADLDWILERYLMRIALRRDDPSVRVALPASLTK